MLTAEIEHTIKLYQIMVGRYLIREVMCYPSKVLHLIYLVLETEYLPFQTRVDILIFPLLTRRLLTGDVLFHGHLHLALRPLEVSDCTPQIFMGASAQGFETAMPGFDTIVRSW